MVPTASLVAATVETDVDDVVGTGRRVAEVVVAVRPACGRIGPIRRRVVARRGAALQAGVTPVVPPQLGAAGQRPAATGQATTVTLTVLLPRAEPKKTR